MKPVYKWLIVGLALVLLGVGYGANQLRLAHQQIDQLTPALPDWEQIAGTRQDTPLPVFAGWYATATQVAPRSLVLDPTLDPVPGAAFEMVYPAFVLRWANGREFVIDPGLAVAGAVEFGRGAELLGAEEVVALGSIWNHADPASTTGIGFTHLHVDHTSGLAGYCDAGGQASVFQSVNQVSYVNYLTSAAAEMLAQTSCIEQIVLGRPGELLQSVPGYPGLYMLQVAGHTPGSQIFIAHLRRGMGRQTLVFAGDIANHIDGVRHNISKPPFYSRFVVPENLQQLEKTRRWLQALDQRPGVTVLLSHDLPALRASGVPEIR